MLAALAPSNFAGYVEPFAGSASLFFKLKPSRAVLGDINPAVIDVYRAIKADPHELSDVLDSIPPTGEAYYALRALDIARLTLAQRAARLIFLMKACFNGVYRTNRAGHFNVPLGSRMYAKPTRSELVDASELLQGVDLVAGDFEATLALSRPGDWVYLDPPYRRAGRYRGEYGVDFGDNSLERLLKAAQSMASSGRHVALSFCDDERLVEQLSGWGVSRTWTRRTVSAAAASRREMVELVFTSY
jgi:DNA adenine methylase